MEKKLFEEMLKNVNSIDDELDLKSRMICLFGHCSATLELVDLLSSKGLRTAAILDNSKEKAGLKYKDVPVISPESFIRMTEEEKKMVPVVLITSRFYASMSGQLRELGFQGEIRKVIDYNTYSEYSLSEDTIIRMKAREEHGEVLLKELDEKYAGYFKVFCPFNALGDVYYMMSYWKAFSAKKDIGQTVFCVSGKVLADVIHLFGDYPAEIFEQSKLDAVIQAAFYRKIHDCYIPHQDRPYFINLTKALYVKRIPLEKIYCCGVYGLSEDTEPDKPDRGNTVYRDIDDIPEGRAVIFSPYAKSVTAIEPGIWRGAVDYYTKAGFKCYTNVTGSEKPLEGTEGISPAITELRSVIERAGTFVGIRSGLCDIIRDVRAKKIALYPDYNYCDTKWKAIEMYYLDKFEHNLMASEDIKWENL